VARNYEGKRPFAKIGVDGRIILNGVLRKYDTRERTVFIWHRTGINMPAHLIKVMILLFP
jgi:hypothetical protein